MIEFYKNLSLENLPYINDEGLVCWEEFRDIPDYEGFYQVSDLGRVKSLNRIIIRSNHNKKIKSQVLKQCEYNKYNRVSLKLNGNNKQWFVHILVAKTFIPNYKNLPKVDHIIEGNKRNNKVGNLQWISIRDNSRKYNNHKNASSYSGVAKSNKKWRADISISNKERIYLGVFDIKTDAYAEYLYAVDYIDSFIARDVEKLKKHFIERRKSRDKTIS